MPPKRKRVESEEKRAAKLRATLEQSVLAKYGESNAQLFWILDAWIPVRELVDIVLSYSEQPIGRDDTLFGYQGELRYLLMSDRSELFFGPLNGSVDIVRRAGDIDIRFNPGGVGLLGLPFEVQFAWSDESCLSPRAITARVNRDAKFVHLDMKVAVAPGVILCGPLEYRTEKEFLCGWVDERRVFTGVIAKKLSDGHAFGAISRLDVSPWDTFEKYADPDDTDNTVLSVFTGDCCRDVTWSLRQRGHHHQLAKRFLLTDTIAPFGQEWSADYTDDVEHDSPSTWADRIFGTGTRMNKLFARLWKAADLPVDALFSALRTMRPAPDPCAMLAAAFP